MYRWNKTKQHIGVLNEPMNSACYIHEASFFDLEKLHEMNFNNQLVGFVDLLLCDAPYDVRCRRDPENTTLDISRPHDMDGICEIVKNMLGSHGHRHVFRPVSRV